MSAVAMVFIRRTGADGTGHVGWGMTLGDDTFLVGSVDNPAHTLHTSPDKMGFWAIRTPDPIDVMQQHRYTELKVIVVEQADPEQALQVISWHSHKPYRLFGCNCMDVTYDVLRSFAVADLPAPAHHWEPNHWFDHVQGQHYQLDEQNVTLELLPLKLARPKFPLPAVGGRVTDLTTAIPPTMPEWRGEETPAWKDLEAAKQNAPPLCPTRTHRHSLIGWLHGLFSRTPPSTKHEKALR
jgi:hypothetical protein